MIPVDDAKLDEFEKLVASNFVDTLDDQVVEGTVIHISDRDAIIDINAKSEGCHFIKRISLQSKP